MFPPRRSAPPPQRRARVPRPAPRTAPEPRARARAASRARGRPRSRMRAGGAGRGPSCGEQRAHVPRAEPRGCLAVLTAALASEQRAPQPQRDPQQPAAALRLARAVVLEQKAEIAAHVLAKHPPPMRRGSDVDALRGGREDGLPPRPREAVAPIGLFAEEEEAL